jgi:invasion protein IalB
MKVKQLAFVFLGLAIIGSGLFLGRNHFAHAGVKEGQKFDDWKIGCVKDADKKTSCFLTQQITVTKDDKQEVLAIYQFGYSASPNKKLNMLQILPLGVSLQAGTGVVVGEKVIIPGKFTVCSALGCHSFAEVSKDELQELLAAEKTNTVFMNLEGKQIIIPISTKGLKEGLEALK